MLNERALWLVTKESQNLLDLISGQITPESTTKSSANLKCKDFVLTLLKELLKDDRPMGSLIKDPLYAWKVLGRHYLKSGNETHREEISQPVVKNETFLASLGSWGYNHVIYNNI